MAFFGNDEGLRIEKTADLGHLRQFQICSGMTKQLASVPQLAVVNAMCSLFTEETCYVLKPRAVFSFEKEDLAFEAPLIDGLYRVSLEALVKGTGK